LLLQPTNVATEMMAITLAIKAQKNNFFVFIVFLSKRWNIRSHRWLRLPIACFYIVPSGRASR
jgi:hypothetical protein